MKQPICANCGQPFIKFRSTERVCGYKCAIEFGVKKEQEKLKRKLQAEKKAKLHDLKTDKQKYVEKILAVKKVFQRWCRIRDAELPCVSCGAMQSDEWHGGHFKKAELFSGVIFDERNVHKQCKKCNYRLHGNELAYRERLVQRFGSEWVEQLESDANATRYYKWTDEELSEIKQKYAKG